MAIYKVGQLARLVNMRECINPDWRNCDGDEVVILGLPGSLSHDPNNYEISCPAHHLDKTLFCFSTPGYRLAPLTDPKAEEFMERIKKLGREPVGHKETLEVRK